METDKGGLVEPYRNRLGMTSFTYPFSKEVLDSIRSMKLVPDYVDEVGIIEYMEIVQPMIAHIKNTKPKVILELGTRLGNSTRILADSCKEFDGKVYTVDIVKCEELWGKYDKEYFNNIEFINADTRTFQWNKPTDLLYIDGDHDALNVYVELERFGIEARVIMLHDVYNEISSQGIRESIAKWCLLNSRAYIIYPGHCGLAVICERK
ncbi:class I SAM-dependent methyltransferase [Patescibacteria group bacterium]|nr:class I SAM-dependent methyltransferase [Patescibacteria group bacterium]